MRKLSVLVIILLLVPLFFYPHTTGPTEVGVRTVKMGLFSKRDKVSLFGKQGVEDRVYQPCAVYFFPAVLNDWHVFDTRLQNIEMMHDLNRGDKPFRDDLLFKTIDGNDISLDVIISYRIDPAKASTIVQYVGTTNFEVKDKVVRTVARSKPRDIFGELKTEEFYVAEKRDEKAEQVKH